MSRHQVHLKDALVFTGAYFFNGYVSRLYICKRDKGSAAFIDADAHTFGSVQKGL